MDKRVVGFGLGAVLVGLFLILILSLQGCGEPTSDDIQRVDQEQLLIEATRQIGMPAITNFRERKLVKMLYELRDQEGLQTWTYTFSPQLGKFVFIGASIGYGIPAATQFTNPEKITKINASSGYHAIPQADPNGLFSPATTDATWVFLIDPKTGKASPQYIEERISVFTYPLQENLVFGK